MDRSFCFENSFLGHLFILILIKPNNNILLLFLFAKKKRNKNNGHVYNAAYYINYSSYIVHKKKT